MRGRMKEFSSAEPGMKCLQQLNLIRPRKPCKITGRGTSWVATRVRLLLIRQTRLVFEYPEEILVGELLLFVRLCRSNDPRRQVLCMRV